MMSLIQFLVNSKSGHREQNARNAVTGASGASPGWGVVTSAQRDLAGLEVHNGRGQCGDVMTMGIRWEMQPSSAAVMQAEIGEMGAVHESSPAPAPGIVLCSALSVPQPVFTITEKAPTRAYWLLMVESAY